ncbi:hypothetical protein DFH08DRAFT_917303 [Mycena albidolilacea]|uniref:Uncharacterized protein n=1 Tax=Mycena albidolilacea TaxID=1033008 RepID=A0AAD6ZF30_9AGAR|nr:hypothetical protein DFH08DRAFT_917303 [Mycena albidolilacea]
MPEHAKARMQWMLDNAWANSTLDKYKLSVDTFHKFCDQLLCCFAVSRAGEITGGTARSAVAAVKAWHIHGGVENLTPESLRREEHPPVTEEMINILEKELDLSEPKDAAVFAAACCAKYFIGHIPMDPDLGPTATAAGTRVLRLPWTKMKGEHGDKAVLCRQRTKSDPVNAIENHVAINAIPADLPLFAYRNENRDHIYLPRRKFLLRCNKIWSKHGIPSTTGHSFRIGGTTHLLIAGVNPEVVRAMGRCKSDAFLVYWCCLDILAPLHAEFLNL